MEFTFLTAPEILFGPGALSKLPRLGARALLVLGHDSPRNQELARDVGSLVLVGAVARCEKEPTIAEVDQAVEQARAGGCDWVVAAGGGAVLDCGKAASAMMTNPGSLEDYLEGVGEGLTIDQRPAPLVAAPTTAGTGSEVTKNAVISGPGYKKSVRSPMMIPRVALVDPELTHTMSPAVTASCGMDAMVQCVESYLSRGATPLTDGLALQGVAAAGRSLARAHEAGDDPAARQDMALASLLGGVCLANAGLGAVHGFASPLGALFPIPHGVACAALFPQVLQANLDASQGTEAGPRLARRTARVARTLGATSAPDDATAAAEGIVWIADLQRRLGIPALGGLGITPEDFPALVRGARGSSMRYNPVDLTDGQLTAILRAAS